MKYLHDSDRLYKKMESSMVIAYVRSKGWTEIPTKPKYMRVFVNKNTANKGVYRQIIIPTDKTLRDYEDAMYNAVKTIAEDEDKTVEQTLRNIGYYI